MDTVTDTGWVVYAKPRRSEFDGTRFWVLAANKSDPTYYLCVTKSNQANGGDYMWAAIPHGATWGAAQELQPAANLLDGMAQADAWLRANA